MGGTRQIDKEITDLNSTIKATTPNRHRALRLTAAEPTFLFSRQTIWCATKQVSVNFDALKMFKISSLFTTKLKVETNEKYEKIKYTLSQEIGQRRNYK